jgi:hypothetical protein
MSLEQEVLRNSKTIAVVGLSSDPMKASFEVSEYMQRNGYRIIPVNPRETKVLGEKAYASLEEVPGQVDVVNVFRRPEQTPQVVRSAIAIGARAVWLQLGIANEEARAIAAEAGIAYVEDRCLLIEHRKMR